MKKELLLQTIVPLLLVSQVGLRADNHPLGKVADRNADLDSRVSILEARMSEISMTTIHGNIGAKTASASPQILGENWFFTGDMLWWHANEGGNDYATVYSTPPSSANSKSTDRKLKFKWDFGFRAGIGTTFNHDRWDLYLNFTWFQTENSAASSLHGGAGLIPLLGAPPLGPNEVTLGSQAKIHWRLHFYTLDLDLGRHYFVSPRLAFHPFVGLKSAWINQNQNTKSKYFLDQLHLKTKTENDFWGIGPQLGMEGKWFLGSCFNLFGSVAGSLLWGDFDVHQKQRDTLLNEETYRLSLDMHSVVPMTQMQIGIGYETNLCHNRYHIAINTRYEHQYWWNQNQMPYFPLPNVYKYRRFGEDLSLQGLTVDVRFDF